MFAEKEWPLELISPPPVQEETSLKLSGKVSYCYHRNIYFNFYKYIFNKSKRERNDQKEATFKHLSQH